MAKLLLTILWGFVALNNYVTSYREITSPDMVGPIWGPGSSCRRQLQFLEGGYGTDIIQPPELRGEWVSTRCEVRSGPEFITRKYKFNSDMSFVLLQFYYTDHQCQLPSYSVRIRGYLQLGATSFAVPGATIAQYELERMSLIAFKVESADHLRVKLNATCLSQIGASSKFQPNERIHILNLAHDHRLIDCASDIGLTVHELQLIRQQARSEFLQDEARTIVWEELLLGNVHSNLTLRKTYRPETFQTPLRRYSENDKDCAICHAVRRGTETDPPILPSRQGLAPAPLHGEWASLTCEVGSSYFITRHLMFMGNDTWETHYHFYKDPLCRTPVYALSMKGTHTPPLSSKLVDGATNVDFTLIAASLTPQHKDMVRTLNAISKSECGGKAIWKLGRTNDVIQNGGCASLVGLLVVKQHDLIRIEEDSMNGLVLYTGILPTDGTLKDSEAKRPTAYQEPLLHCEGPDPRTASLVTDMDNNGNSVLLKLSAFFISIVFSFVL